MSTQTFVYNFENKSYAICNHQTSWKEPKWTTGQETILVFLKHLNAH